MVKTGALAPRGTSYEQIQTPGQTPLQSAAYRLGQLYIESQRSKYASDLEWLVPGGPNAVVLHEVLARGTAYEWSAVRARWQMYRGDHDLILGPRGTGPLRER